MGGLGGDHLYDVAVFQAGIKGDQTAVDLGPHHVVAHGGVDVIGEVDGRGSGGEVDDVATGGEHEHLVGKHIHLQGVDEVLGVGALLILQQAADPLIAALVSGPLTVLLVLPVGGDAVFGGAQVRTTQMAEFYTMVNAAFRDKEAAAKHNLQWSLLLISLLSLSLILLIAQILKQMKNIWIRLIENWNQKKKSTSI